jgi:NADPH:quinone reductase
MKAAVCKSLDGPAAITVEDVPAPKAGYGEVVVAVSHASLNFLDTLITRGKYQYKPTLPFSPAAEFGGTVAEIGDGVTSVKVGQRVCGYSGWGAAAERIVVKADAVTPVPDAVSLAVASGVTVTYGTAMHGLKDRGRLKAGETVAVLGASGGAGLAAVEIAKLMGARVIAVASSDDKLAVCRERGADAVLNYTTTDLKQGLRDLSASLNGGASGGVDVIYDCVGGDHAEAALRSIAWMGRFLVVGFAAGPIPKIPLNLALLKSCDICGVFWGEAAVRDPASIRANITQVLDWVATGKLAPHIHATFPLARIGDAISLLDRREATGKVVVEI